jgi:hypothetical protein
MRSAWLVLVLLAACDRGKLEKDDDKPRLPTATGSFELDVPHPELTDALLETEAEVVHSASLVRMVNERRTLVGDLDRWAVHAQRRPHTKIIDVFVNDPDGSRAKFACDELIREFLESRAARARYPLADRAARLRAELETNPDSVPLKRMLAEIEQQLTSRPIGGDRLLGRCKLGAPRSAVVPPQGPITPGSFMLDPLPPPAATKTLVAAIETLNSDELIAKTNERVRADAGMQGVELKRTAIHATRRGDSMIVDVIVDDDDPEHAALLTNLLIDSFLHHRKEQLFRESVMRSLDVHLLDPSTPVRSSAATAKPATKP